MVIAQSHSIIPPACDDNGLPSTWQTTDVILGGLFDAPVPVERSFGGGTEGLGSSAIMEMRMAL